jgi:glyoxylase-like metal-dependent hydrolase (beta-lactamase superfamily II)
MEKSINSSALSINANIFGTVSTIHPVLLWDEDGATLIDTGYPCIFPQLKQAVEQKIQSFSQIKRIILTHQDWDHIGTVPDILETLKGHVQIFAHSLEQPYLEGRVQHYKLTPERIAARIQQLPEFMQAEAHSLMANYPKFSVDCPMEDGELLPFHGGIKVIHVPGHTPGNISLYVQAARLLIAGDQLRIDKDMLVGPAPEHTPDMPTATQSLKKLLPYEIDTIICYHGGTYTANVAARLAEIAAD